MKNDDQRIEVVIDEEQKKIVQKQMEEDLGISREDSEEIINEIGDKIAKDIERKIKIKTFAKKYLYGITTILISALFAYIAITEKKQIYIFLAAVMFGMGFIDILHGKTKSKQEVSNPVRYCAQILDKSNDVVRKSKCFPSIETSAAWAKKLITTTEKFQIMDTTDGKIIKTLSNRR